MRFNAITLAVLGALAFNFNTFAQASSSANATELNDPLAVPTDEPEMERIIVVGEAMEQPLVVVANPKQIRQPLPAHDAADYLKSIAGFSTIRKGGASGDLLFRGMAASRINILADGETLLGGCGNRMDPPTAYITPQSYDRMVVLKGPQNVTNGPGSSAATVRFEREWEYYPSPTTRAFLSSTLAEFGRFDMNADVTFGNSLGFTRINATSATSSDYKDGSGTRIHSAYERWSGQTTFGYTPNEDTILSISIGVSDGEAAYADRAMDGVKFARESIGVRYAQRNVSPLIAELTGQFFYNYIDHVMDNYSLREFSSTMMMPNQAASNPDRRTRGGRLSAVLEPSNLQRLELGVDTQLNAHRVRNSMNQAMMPYETMAFMKDADFTQVGVFLEHRIPLPENEFGNGELIWGARSDFWTANDYRQQIRQNGNTYINPTANTRRSETLLSGFVRYEAITDFGNVYIGPGYVERFPDYWELVGANRAGADSRSAFNTAAERTLQLDVGWIATFAAWNHSLALFVSQVNDYILIDSQHRIAGVEQALLSVRNVDAQTYGGELDIGYEFNSRWRVDGSVAYVRGKNTTDGNALAQQPPLEMKLSARYAAENWSVNGLLRAVARQHRVAIGQGNIVGTDLNETAGFAVVSISADKQLRSQLRLSVGMDNLFNRSYGEHLSKSGAMVSGYLPVNRVNEPGRLLWANLQWQL